MGQDEGEGKEPLDRLLRTVFIVTVKEEEESWAIWGVYTHTEAGLGKALPLLDEGSGGYILFITCALTEIMLL